MIKIDEYRQVIVEKGFADAAKAVCFGRFWQILL